VAQKNREKLVQEHGTGKMCMCDHLLEEHDTEGDGSENPGCAVEGCGCGSFLAKDYDVEQWGHGSVAE
jgi:hypothetical protein